MDGARTLRSGREGMVQSGGTWHDLLDLRAAVDEAKANPSDNKGTMVALYGLGQSSAVGPGLVTEVANRFLDVVRLSSAVEGPSADCTSNAAVFYLIAGWTQLRCGGCKEHNSPRC